MKSEAYLMYPVHALLLSSRAELSRNPVYSGHTLLGFLPIKYQEYYTTVQEIDERKFSGNATLSQTSGLVRSKRFNPRKQFQKIIRRKWKQVKRGYDKFWMALQGHDDDVTVMK